jgi:hypothetical protein
MGKFEEVMEVNMEKMKDLSPEEKEKQMKEWMIKTKGICNEYCGKCPTYEGTGKKILFSVRWGKVIKLLKKKDVYVGNVL